MDHYYQNHTLTTTQLNVECDTIIAVHTTQSTPSNSTSTRKEGPCGLKFCMQPHLTRLPTTQHNLKLNISRPSRPYWNPMEANLGCVFDLDVDLTCFPSTNLNDILSLMTIKIATFLILHDFKATNVKPFSHGSYSKLILVKFENNDRYVVYNLPSLYLSSPSSPSVSFTHSARSPHVIFFPPWYERFNYRNFKWWIIQSQGLDLDSHS